VQLWTGWGVTNTHRDNVNETKNNLRRRWTKSLLENRTYYIRFFLFLYFCWWPCSKAREIKRGVLPCWWWQVTINDDIRQKKRGKKVYEKQTKNSSLSAYNLPCARYSGVRRHGAAKSVTTSNKQTSKKTTKITNNNKNKRMFSSITHPHTHTCTH